MLDGHNLVVEDERAGTREPVFPADFQLDDCFLVHHHIDRGSTGGSLIFFGIHQGYMWTVSWGFFHDMWNSIKNSAKHFNGSNWWKMVTKFSSISNLNHGPYRSGAWGKSKQTYHKRYMDSHTENSADFRSAADKTAQLLGQYATSMDYSYWCTAMGKLPSCCEAGPVCKHARWHSIEQ